jgi:signal transduction histidine kinase
MERMQPQARRSGQTLVLTGTATMGRVDRSLLEGVLVNLIGNASRASPRDATIELRMEGEPTQVTIEVESAAGEGSTFRIRLPR